MNRAACPLIVSTFVMRTRLKPILTKPQFDKSRFDEILQETALNEIYILFIKHSCVVTNAQFFS